MKIISWNVNGLRAVLDKGVWSGVENLNADIALLQEIKTRPEQLSPAQAGMLQGWQISWNPAQRPGYSGVATLAKGYGLHSTAGLGHPDFDGEGRVIATHIGKIWLYNIYFPNGRNDLSRVGYKLDFYRHLLKLCGEIQQAGESVIMAGDFNTCHQPIDLKNAKANERQTGFLPEERAMIDEYLQAGFVDIYRHLYPEKVQYSWWAYHSNARARGTGWRLDYFLVSKDLVGQVKDAVIHDDLLGSDHCPVSLELEL